MHSIDAFDPLAAFARSGAMLATSPEMSARIAQKDWSKTPLGDPSTWPPALHTVLSVMLCNRFPMVFWWGPELVQLYNDPYRPILGAKHPESLGQSARECWAEIWDVIGPQITSIYNGSPSTWNVDLLLDMNRHGFIEETYFTFAYSPIPDRGAPGGIGGVLATVQETTQKVIGERRMMLLRDLAVRSADAKTAQEECSLAVGTLAKYAKAMPFSLIYLVSEDRTAAHLAAATGIEETPASAPPDVDLTAPSNAPWPLREALDRGSIVIVEQLEQVLANVPPGPWPNPPHRAAVVPLDSNLPRTPAGFLVCGLNPRLAFDDAYRSFLSLAGAQISTAIGVARSYEQERKRAEALAEIDRAKTEFFSNVSHEFRTPLTLMLGPIASALRDPQISDAAKTELQTAERNARRLQRLVNTLLEFSRIQAGGSEVHPARTDLCGLTRDLASTFRSAIETAGLRFVVECPADPIYADIDRAMWERVVLNLLSNALKFTLEGGIAVRLSSEEGCAVLTVSDTGVGIASEDLPHVFDRFRRARVMQGRSAEGSGIGLALVRELVGMMQGTIEAQSAPDSGTTFRITLPESHVRSESDAREATAVASVETARQYLAEVEGWSPPSDMQAAEEIPEREGVPHVLVIDDNADLRGYMQRILRETFNVRVAPGGREALELLESERFALIITDIMMPGVDGLQILKHVRETPSLSATPVILVSARAGEESFVEGLRLGADDYLVKPFSAGELIARAEGHVRLAGLRGEIHAAEDRYGALSQLMPGAIWTASPDGRVDFVSDRWRELTGAPDGSAFASGWEAYAHPDDLERMNRVWADALQTGEPFSADWRLRSQGGAYRSVMTHARAERAADGTISRWHGVVTDIDASKREERIFRFLIETNEPFNAPYNAESTLRAAADAAVPTLADWCAISLKRDGHVEQVAIAHTSAAKLHLVEEIQRRYSQRDNRVEEVIRTGKPLLMPSIPQETFDAAAQDPEHLAMLKELDIASVMIVPLKARDAVLGAVVFAAGHSRPPFDQLDLDAATIFSNRAAIAVEHAGVFERNRRVATEFQQASMPDALPEIPGIQFSAYYRPGREALVGGDWFDALELSDGRIVLSIGDVAGSGLEAAVTMSNVRQIFRGIAQINPEPDLLLQAADKALRAESPDRIVTAFVAVYDPVTGMLRHSSAGHPPPYLRHADGESIQLYGPGLPLGLRNLQEEPTDRFTPIVPGDTLVLYTDGLTEATKNVIEGDEIVRRALRDPATVLAINLHDSVLESEPPDDVAILTMHVLQDRSAGVRRWAIDATDQNAARRMRMQAVAALADFGCSHEECEAAQTIVGELIGNVVRHAGPLAEIVLDTTRGAAVLHVFDEGKGIQHIPGLPADPLSETGRGLFLIAALAREFNVTRRPTGGSHARVLLCGKPRQRP